MRGLSVSATSVFNLTQIAFLPVDTDKLHTSHPGMVKMKSLAARTHVWWPLIDRHIEQMVRDCKSCQSVRNRPPTALLHPWSWPDGPWKRIHVDFTGPVFGSMFMVVVDAHSKWMEVIPMSTTTTEKTLEVLRNLFASYGLPEQLVSDNSPQFTSSDFELCTIILAIRSAVLIPIQIFTAGCINLYDIIISSSNYCIPYIPGQVCACLSRAKLDLSLWFVWLEA